MSVKKPNDPLTTLLTNLPSVHERGFTERVMLRVQARQLRRRGLFFTAWCCSLVGIVLSLPLERLVAATTDLLYDSSATWIDLAHAKQLTRALDAYLQMSNFNIVLALSAGAVLVVLTTFALHQD